MIRRLLAITTLLVLAAGAAASAQSRAGEEAPPKGPWLGVPLPPKLGGVPAVLVGSRGVRPAIVPQGESGYRELEGKSIRAVIRY